MLKLLASAPQELVFPVTTFPISGFVSDFEWVWLLQGCFPNSSGISILISPLTGNLNPSYAAPPHPLRLVGVKGVTINTNTIRHESNIKKIVKGFFIPFAMLC